MSLRAVFLATTMLFGIAGAFNPVASGAADMSVTPPLLKAPPMELPPPAVDGVNFKLDGLGGTIANRSLYGSQGAVAIPLGGQYGLQVDGAAGSFDDRFFGSTAGHLFWRDPGIGLAGAYASYTDWKSPVGNAFVAKYGGEGEFYLGRWTAQGVAGVESGSNRTATVGPFIDTINVATRFFDEARIAYYLTDNLKFAVGHAFTGGKHAATVGGEWSFAAGGGRMASLFAEGRFGEHNDNGVWGGLRIYFGQHDKSLIRRNREDDPVTDLPNNLYAFTNPFGQSSVPPTLNPPPPCGGHC